MIFRFLKVKSRKIEEIALRIIINCSKIPGS